MHRAGTTDGAPLSVSDRVRGAILDVPNFPTEGILFKDITGVLADVAVMRDLLGEMTRPFLGGGITHVAAVESRGFLFGVPIALQLSAAFVPVRKPGKLPRATVQERYSLEYGSDALEIHRDAFSKNAKVLIVDDILATGGTAAAAVALVRRLGATVCGISVVSELEALRGRDHLAGIDVHAIVKY